MDEKRDCLQVELFAYEQNEWIRARRTIVRNAKRRCEIENAKSEEFDIDYATERRGQYDYRPDYTDKH